MRVVPDLFAKKEDRQECLGFSDLLDRENMCKFVFFEEIALVGLEELGEPFRPVIC